MVYAYSDYRGSDYGKKRDTSPLPTENGFPVGRYEEPNQPEDESDFYQVYATNPDALFPYRSGTGSPSVELTIREADYSKPWWATRKYKEKPTKAQDAAMGYGQLPLFKYSPPEFEHLAADPSMKSAVPTVLAHALTRYPNAIASKMLSPHSSRIVQRAQREGLLQPNPSNPTGEDVLDGEGRWSKDMERYTATDEIGLPHGNRQLSVTEIREAKATARRILRPKNLSQQFGPTEPHPRLPGIEDG